MHFSTCKYYAGNRLLVNDFLNIFYHLAKKIVLSVVRNGSSHGLFRNVSSALEIHFLSSLKEEVGNHCAAFELSLEEKGV